MNHETTAVLLLEQDEKLQNELHNAGVSVSVYSGKSIRNSLRDLASDTKYSIFVTVDPADGFSANDILKVAGEAQAHPADIIVGERKTPEKKSLAHTIYCFLAGVETKDITSSLVGMSRENLDTMLAMKGSDKLFLQNIILEARAKGIAVKDVETGAALKTEPGFNILKTAKLYLVFIKFSISAFISYLVDIGTFYIFQKVFSFLDDEFKILTATVLSRILCSIATYILNKSAVFQSQAKSAGAAIRFVILAAVQLIASWLLVWGIGSLLGGGDEVNTILKVIVDLVIFMASFTIQRDWVFKESKGFLK